MGAVSDGDDLYHLEADALRALDPTLVVTQDLCAVCAVDVTTVDDALAHLGCTAEVLTVDPHTLEEVLESVLLLGKATGHDDAAAELVQSLRLRMAAVWRSTLGLDRPRVAVLEWTDPPYAPGHWIPEMVELAGGDSTCSARPARSRPGSAGRTCTRPGPTSWSWHRAATTARARRPRPTLSRTCLPAGVRVHAVDADGMWARPGPRLVDGVEELASVLRRPLTSSPSGGPWSARRSRSPPRRG